MGWGEEGKKQPEFVTDLPGNCLGLHLGDL